MQKLKRLALVGHGKMGKLIDQLSPEYGFEVTLRLDSRSNPEARGITREAFAGVDAAIEFSSPEAAPLNLRRLAEIGIPTATGTTGWFYLLPELTQVVESSGAGLVWSPNFSVGVAVFRRPSTDCGVLLEE